MRTTTLGKSGLDVSAVGFGGIPIQRLSDEEAVQTLHAALDLGVTFIDTAAGYGDSQRKIGRAIADRRDGLIIATKSGQAGAGEMTADIDRSLSEMGIDCIDLFQFHGVNSAEKWDRIRSEGALDAVLEARDAGRIAHIGYTSHSAETALDLAEEELFETVQFPFNLVTTEPAEALIPKAREKGLGFIVMKPLCGGQFDDAELAFEFLNGYPDLVPIPGIQSPAEIEQIAGIVDSGRRLEGERLAEAQRLAEELGKKFCRRCGYCMPCPEGVPITMAMIFPGMLKRMPEEKVRHAQAKAIVEKVPACVECRQCEQRCPYELPIVENLKESLALARSVR